MSGSRARVAVLRASPETVLDDYRRLLGLLELPPAFSAAATADVVLKAELPWARFFPGATSPPWQLEGVIRALLGAGLPRARLLGCLEQNPTVDTLAGARASHHRSLLEKYGLRCLDLGRSTEWVPYRPRTPLMVLPDLFTEGLRLPRRLIGTSVVHLPTLKTHGGAAVSGALQSALALLLGKARWRTAGVLHETLVDLTALERELHPGRLAVMDGSFAGDGSGPRCLVPYVKDLLLASTDPVALDAVAARLMGMEPLSIRYLRLCHERGLGVADPARIDIVGEDPGKVGFQFRRELPTFLARVEQRLHDFPFRPLMKPLLRTPLLGLGHAVSRLYHDGLWFPFVGESRSDEMMTTKWGRLFATYQHGGVASPHLPAPACW
jgi:uncharacterized protein (DUF362 family)